MLPCPECQQGTGPAFFHLIPRTLSFCRGGAETLSEEVAPETSQLVRELGVVTPVPNCESCSILEPNWGGEKQV